jgi:hypothetical protein
VRTRLTGFNAHGITAFTGMATRMTEAAEFWDFVVKATMSCGIGETADCEGFVRTASPPAPFATQKPKLFTCKAKKCSSANTYTLEVRIKITRKEIIEAREAEKPLRQTLRLRSGCRGTRGQLRTFALVFTNGNFFSRKLSDLNGKQASQ